MKLAAIVGSLTLLVATVDGFKMIVTGNSDKKAKPNGSEMQTSAYYAAEDELYDFRCCSAADPRESGITKSIKSYNNLVGDYPNPFYAFSYDSSKKCPGKKNYADAEAFCVANNARLCTADEVYELKLGSGSGCSLDKYLIWTSTDTTPPGPVPVSTDETSSHQVVCGGAGQSGDNCKVDGVRYPSYIMADTSEFAVRCCADRNLMWEDMQSCDDPMTYGGSYIPFYKGFGEGQCHMKATFATAEALCANADARLCTFDELMAECSEGTGCSMNNEFVWSSTVGSFPEPIVDSEADHWLVCRTKGGDNCRDADGNKVDAIKAKGTDRHPVSCCADTALNWNADDVQSYFPNLFTGSEIPLVGDSGASMCHTESTWAEAERLCSDAGARLCTFNEIAKGGAASTGCSLDKEFIWSSDLYTERIITPTVKEHRLVCGSDNGDNCKDENGEKHLTYQARDEELRAVRCCADDGDLYWVDKRYPPTEKCPVWGGSELANWPFINNPDYAECHFTTHYEASYICEANGGRLCTLLELANGCSSGTGCSYDKEFIWSADVNTPSTAVEPSNGHHDVGCGNPTKTSADGCKDEAGKFFRTYRQADDLEHYFRCCTEQLPSFINEREAVKNAGCSVYSVSYLPLIAGSHSKQDCGGKLTHWEAENACAVNDMRLCSENEIESGCARSSGCSLDKEWIWSGTESCKDTAACELAARDEYKLGCHASTKTFPQFPFNLGPYYDIEECYQTCLSAGYAYFGMKNGEYCSCGDDYTATPAVDDSECDRECLSGPGTCGGEHSNTVFRTGNSVTPGDNYESKHFGCFVSEALELVPGGIKSIRECVDSCIAKDFSYAALGDGGTCFCQNDKPQIRTSDCSIGCEEGKGLCGGAMGRSFYRAANKPAIESLGLCKGSKSSWWGDPHLITYDGLAYNCQGVGHFTLTKCPEYELQGKFKPATFGKASVTDGVAAKYLDYPVVEISIADFTTPFTKIVNDCPVHVVVGGEIVNQTEVMSEIVDISLSGGRYSVQFRGEGPALTAKIRKGRGCLLDVDVCVPSECARNVVGMLGTPDGDKTNEWMRRSDSVTIELPSDYKGQGGYDYCTSQWCVATVDDSLFSYLGPKGFADYDDCAKLFPGDIPHDDVTDEERELCKQAENEEDCLDEAAIGGREAIEETIDNDLDLDPDDGTVNHLCELPSYIPKYTLITSGNTAVQAKNTYTGFVVGGEYFINNNNQISIYSNANGLSEGEKKSYYRSVRKLNPNQSKFQGNGDFIQTTDPLGEAGIDWQQLIWLTENVKDSIDGDYKVFRVTNGGNFHQESFIGDVTDDTQGQKTLIFFDTTEDINLILTPRQKKWGPCIIAPKAKVTLTAGVGFADGFIYSKEFVSAGTEQQLHGDIFDGQVYCDEDDVPEPPSNSCGYELIEDDSREPISQIPGGDPFSFVRANGETVTFAVTQTWKPTDTISGIIPVYKKVNGGDDCLEDDKKTSESVPGGNQPGKTYEFVAKCENGFADVRVIIKDGNGFGGTVNAPECRFGNFNSKHASYKMRFSCEPCGDAPEPTAAPTSKPTANPTSKPTANPTMAPPPAPCPYAGDSTTECPAGGDKVTTRLRKGEPLGHMPAGKDLIYNLQVDGERTDRTVSFSVDNPFDFPVDMYVQYETRVGQFSTDPSCEAELAKPACDADGASVITAACDDHPHLDRPPFALVNIYYVSREASFLSDGYVTNDDGYVYECCEQEEGTKGDPLVHYALKIDCGCPTATH